MISILELANFERAQVTIGLWQIKKGYRRLIIFYTKISITNLITLNLGLVCQCYLIICRLCEEFCDTECQEEPELLDDGEACGHWAARAGDVLSAPHHQGCRLQVSYKREREGAGSYFCPFRLQRWWRGKLWLSAPHHQGFVDCRAAKKGRGQVDSAHFGWEEGGGAALTVRLSPEFSTAGQWSERKGGSR